MFLRGHWLRRSSQLRLWLRLWLRLRRLRASPVVPQEPMAKSEVSKPPPTPQDGILIYRATGALQCEPGKGTPLEQVEAQLVAKKILVYDGHTQPDGLMHMALCGSPSGTIHVFTISRKDLRKGGRNISALKF